MKRLVLILSLLVASDAWAFSYATGGCATSSCAEGEQWLYTNANEVDTALDSIETNVTALQALDTFSEMQTAEGVNVILATEIDTVAEVNAITTDEDFLVDSDIGVAVQAYDADLADLADGSLSGSKIGTGLDITTATAGTLATARMSSDATLDSEWNSAAEINAATQDLDFMTTNSTLSMLTTGSVSAKVPTFSGATGGTLTASGALGHFRVYTGGGAATFNLPAPEDGLSVCFYSATAQVVTVDVDSASTTITLDGVGLSGGDSIDSAGAAGDYICLLAISSTEWITLGRSGTWVDGDV